LPIIKGRLPSTRDLVLVFSICAFPIYVWSILNMLHKVPAWVKAFSIWDVIGIIAYTQAFTLIETLIVFLGLVLLGAVLPAKFLRDKFVAKAGILILSSAIMIILAHLNNYILPYIGAPRGVAFFLYMGLLGATYLVSIVIFYYLIDRYKKFEDAVQVIGDRLAPLSFLYMVMGVSSIFIVIYRNVS
jgi:hypothetical protein